MRGFKIKNMIKKSTILFICLLFGCSTPVFAEPEDGNAYKKRSVFTYLFDTVSWNILPDGPIGTLSDNEHLSKDKKYKWRKDTVCITYPLRKKDQTGKNKDVSILISYYSAYSYKAHREVTGWEKIDGKWYYFTRKKGKFVDAGYSRMASNEWINGYYFNKNGTWTRKNRAFWKQNKNGWKYKDKTGWYAKNCKLFIDGKWYYFNEKGYRVTGWQKLKGKWYFFNKKGQMIVNNNLEFKKTNKSYHFCWDGTSVPYSD